MGAGLTHDLAQTSRELQLSEALACGLVNRSATENRSLDVAIRVAQEVQQGAPLSLATTKVNLKGSEFELAERQVESINNMMLDSNDAIEGALAFEEKRAPKWRNK